MIKIIIEEISIKNASALSGLSIKKIEDLIEKDKDILVSDFFTVQWHITQKCNLSCKHCYDRTSRIEPTLDEGIQILNDIKQFYTQQNVRGQVTFTGGNPLLHDDFIDFYKHANEIGLYTAILGYFSSLSLLYSLP